MEKKVIPASPESSLASAHVAKLPLHPKKGPNIFWLHTKVLVWKQFLVFTRNIRSTLFQVITPVFICVFLLVLQEFATYGFNSTTQVIPDIFSLKNIPKCYGSGCITLGVAYTNSTTKPLPDYVIRHISKYQNLEIGTDIQVIANNYNDLINYLTINTNKTQTVVLFCTGAFEISNNSLYNGAFNCDRVVPGMNIPIYSLLINSTITPLTLFSGFNTPSPIDYASLSVKAALDSAISHTTKIHLPFCLQHWAI